MKIDDLIASLKPHGYPIDQDMAGLYMSLIMETRATRVLELGSGKSTVLAASLGCHVVALEHEVYYATKTRELLIAYREEADVRWAPIVDGWYDRTALIPGEVFDLVLVDGPLGSIGREQALPFLLSFLTPSAVLIVDDANRACERRMVVAWQATYPEFHVTLYPEGKGAAVFRRQC